MRKLFVKVSNGVIVSYLEAVREDWTGVSAPQGMVEITNVFNESPATLIGRTYSNNTVGNAPQSSASRRISHYQFRKRFTLQELIGMDNADLNQNIPSQTKAALKTMLKNFEAAEYIDLDNADVATGLATLEQVGLIAAGRAAQILA